MKISAKELVRLFGESALELQAEQPALARLVARMAVLAAHVDMTQRVTQTHHQAMVNMDQMVAGLIQQLGPLLQAKPEGENAAPPSAPPAEGATETPGGEEEDAVERMVADAMAATAADAANVPSPKPPAPKAENAEGIPEVTPLAKRRQK